MITVRHRPQAKGSETEYTMAMGQVDFILLHELVKQARADLLDAAISNPDRASVLALLVVIDARMAHPLQVA